ncbi:hypothetical protein M0805_003640 [Coniferiporia weirii]|nr:hypothetical protein M0805_003640 [Coniferiporia weirii]
MKLSVLQSSPSCSRFILGTKPEYTYIRTSAFFEATASDWRESTLRSAYTGILNADAFEYELGRLRGLQDLKRRKIQEAAERYSYNRSAQLAARIGLGLLVYSHVVFGVKPVIIFLLKLVFNGEKELPPTRFGPHELVSSLLMTPVILGIVIGIFHLIGTWLSRMWEKQPSIVALVFFGFMGVFFSLLHG